VSAQVRAEAGERNSTTPTGNGVMDSAWSSTQAPRSAKTGHAFRSGSSIVTRSIAHSTTTTQQQEGGHLHPRPRQPRLLPSGTGSQTSSARRPQNRSFSART